jgi:PAS domain S-box-containing protein
MHLHKPHALFKNKANAMKNHKQKTILLVEDDAATTILNTDLLNSFGYDVIPAKSGEEAVQIATGNDKIDLILMDINLGFGIDGTEAAKQILGKRNLPIVFLSSHMDKEYVERAKKIASYGYVIKNSGDFVLQSSIEMAFNLFKAEEAIRDSERKFRLLFEFMTSGFALHKIIRDKAGNPCDYCFLQVNPAFETITGLKSGDVIGRTVLQVLPDTGPVCIERYERVTTTGESVQFEHFSQELDRHYQVIAYHPEAEHVAIIMQDITDCKKAMRK